MMDAETADWEVDLWRAERDDDARREAEERMDQEAEAAGELPAGV